MTQDQRNIQNTIAALMQSETMSKLVAFSKSMPIDATNPEDLKVAFSVSIECLVEALDHDRIKFDQAHDKALFFGLLCAALQYVTEGQLSSDAIRARMN